jgi:hypothetical protein
LVGRGHLHDTLRLSGELFGWNKDEETGPRVLFLLVLVTLSLLLHMLMRLQPCSKGKNKSQRLSTASDSGHMHVASCEDGWNSSSLAHRQSCTKMCLVVEARDP